MAEAYTDYEAQQAGLGDRFHDEVAKMLKRIEANPRLYPMSETTPYRKATVDIFPFCIYYCVLGQKIVIIAVHNMHRDPRRWQTRG